MELPFSDAELTQATLTTIQANELEPATSARWLSRPGADGGQPLNAPVRTSIAVLALVAATWARRIDAG